MGQIEIRSRLVQQDRSSLPLPTPAQDRPLPFAARQLIHQTRFKPFQLGFNDDCARDFDVAPHFPNPTLLALDHA